MTDRARSRGVMLIDLLVAVAIIGVVVLAVVPMVRTEGPLQLVSGTTMIAADIEFAQSRTLAQPSDPTIVCVRDDGSGYWLALLSDPTVPIDDPKGSRWERVFGVGTLAELDGCTIGAIGLERLPDDGPHAVVFDSFGRLGQEGDGAIRLTNDAGEQFVTVRASTGSVAIVAEYDAGEDPPSKPVGKPGQGGYGAPLGGGSSR